jgi:hypothetical protein
MTLSRFLNSTAPPLLSHISPSMESALLNSSALIPQENGVVALDFFIGSRDPVIRHRLVDKLPSYNHADLVVNVR